MINTLATQGSLSCLEPREVEAVKIGLAHVVRLWHRNPVWDRDDMVHAGIVAVLAIRAKGKSFADDPSYVAYASGRARSEMRKLAVTALAVSGIGAATVPKGVAVAAPLLLDVPSASKELDDSDERHRLFVEYATGNITDVQRAAIGMRFGVLGYPKGFQSDSLKNRAIRRAVQRAVKKLKDHFVDGKPLVHVRSPMLKDLSGVKKGTLLAMEPVFGDGSVGSVKWLCECDCGKTVHKSCSEFNRIRSCSPSCPLRNKRKKEVSNKSA